MTNANIYVAFDGKNDLEYYEKLKEFTQEDGSKFNFTDGFEFYSQVDKVDDDQLKQNVLNKVKEASIVVVLMGTTTKTMRKYIRWQVEGAINLGLPIIVVNENNIRSIDFDRCPMLVKKSLSLHISFNEKVLRCAVEAWPALHYGYVNKEKKGLFRFPAEVYTQLGIETPVLE